MAIITQGEADTYRDAYRNAVFSAQLQPQKNLEAALFDLNEVQNLIDSVKELLPEDVNGKKYLKLFVVYKDNYLNLCMTGGERGQNFVNPEIGKREFYANLDGDTQHIDDVLIGLPCPPHCGQGGDVPNGLDNKYVTG